jgi:hypothetical protein
MDNPILILLVGIGLSFVGYGPLSLKKNPKAGIVFAVVGFVFRLAGPLLLFWGVLVGLFLVFGHIP